MYMLQVKITFRLKFFNLGWFSISWDKGTSIFYGSTFNIFNPPLHTTAKFKWLPPPSKRNVKCYVTPAAFISVQIIYYYYYLNNVGNIHWFRKKNILLWPLASLFSRSSVWSSTGHSIVTNFIVIWFTVKICWIITAVNLCWENFHDPPPPPESKTATSWSPMQQKIECWRPEFQGQSPRSRLLNSQCLANVLNYGAQGINFVLNGKISHLIFRRNLPLVLSNFLISIENNWG